MTGGFYSNQGSGKPDLGFQGMNYLIMVFIIELCVCVCASMSFCSAMHIFLHAPFGAELFLLVHCGLGLGPIGLGLQAFI